MKHVQTRHIVLLLFVNSIQTLYTFTFNAYTNAPHWLSRKHFRGYNTSLQILAASLITLIDIHTHKCASWSFIVVSAFTHIRAKYNGKVWRVICDMTNSSLGLDLVDEYFHDSSSLNTFFYIPTSTLSHHHHQGNDACIIVTIMMLCLVHIFVMMRIYTLAHKHTMLRQVASKSECARRIISKRCAIKPHCLTWLPLYPTQSMIIINSALWCTKWFMRLLITGHPPLPSSLRVVVCCR